MVIGKIIRFNFIYLSKTQAFVPLFSIKEVVCELKIEEQLFLFTCCSSGFRLLEDKNRQIDCRIYCKNENFFDLLNKKVRLQQMLDDPNVLFDGKYKHLLLLESIFAVFKNIEEITDVQESENAQLL